MTNPLFGLKLPLGIGFFHASWTGSAATTSESARQDFVNMLVEAMDAGVRLFDTADIYAPTWDTMGHNELLLRDAIRAWSGSPEDKSSLIIATKGGITRSVGEVWSKDASLDYLMKRVNASLENLDMSEIPLWQHHRLDFHLTLAEQLQNLKHLKAQAPIRCIGVSNYSASQLRQALDVLGGPADGGIISVQNQLNPAYRQQLDVLEVCEEHGLAYLPWSPMKGMSAKDADTLVFQRFDVVAKRLGVSTFAVSQAWLRSLSPTIVPLPGVTRAQSLRDTLSAVDLRLTQQDLAQLADLPESLPLDAELVRDQPLPALG